MCHFNIILYLSLIYLHIIDRKHKICAYLDNFVGKQINFIKLFNSIISVYVSKILRITGTLNDHEATYLSINCNNLLFSIINAKSGAIPLCLNCLADGTRLIGLFRKHERVYRHIVIINLI